MEEYMEEYINIIPAPTGYICHGSRCKQVASHIVETPISFMPGYEKGYTNVCQQEFDYITNFLKGTISPFKVKDNNGEVIAEG